MANARFYEVTSLYGDNGTISFFEGAFPMQYVPVYVVVG